MPLTVTRAPEGIDVTTSLPLDAAAALAEDRLAVTGDVLMTVVGVLSPDGITRRSLMLVPPALEGTPAMSVGATVVRS